jgi:ketosteroid isomerase-like protein
MSTSVEQRNIDMARRGYQAFNEGHLDEAMATIHDEILWHNGGDNPITGDFRGKDAVMEMLARFGQITEGTYEADIHDVLASEDHTVVIGTYTATRHGRTHSSRFVDVIHPAPDGRAKEFWRFFDDVAAEDEFLKE